MAHDRRPILEVNDLAVTTLLHRGRYNFLALQSQVAADERLTAARAEQQNQRRSDFPPMRACFGFTRWPMSSNWYAG